MTRFLAMLEILIFAAIGGLAAIAADIATSFEAALVYRATGLLELLTRFRFTPQTSLLLAAGALIVAGAFSVFYVRPLGRKGAFGCGFCAIAVLSLITP